MDSREVNIVFLNNAGIKRVEVHNKDNLVVKLSHRFEHKVTFVLRPVVLVLVLVLGALSSAVSRRYICLISFCLLLGSNSGLFPPGLVRDDIFELVVMQKDALIPSCSPTVKDFVPSLRLNNRLQYLEEYPTKSHQQGLLVVLSEARPGPWTQ